MSDHMTRWAWPAAYIGSVVLVNWGFSTFPGEEWFWSLIVGGIFVTRDLCQRAIGHWCIAAMAVAGLLSWWMADPLVALASVTAFAVAELADWGVYTATKRPLADRILLSSAISTPLDSVVFLGMIGALTPELVALQVGVKMAAAGVVWLVMHAAMKARA